MKGETPKREKKVVDIVDIRGARVFASQLPYLFTVLIYLFDGLEDGVSAVHQSV